jgi:hypothetical protein
MRETDPKPQDNGDAPTKPAETPREPLDEVEREQTQDIIDSEKLEREFPV